MSRVVISKLIPEQTSRRFSIVFRNHAGQPFVPDEVLATLYDIDTETIINSRNKQSIMNQNGGHFTGTDFVIELHKEDTIIVNSKRGRESHLLIITTVWEGGARVEHTEIEHVIQNIGQVP
jgi:hypothetical protein